MSNKLLSVARAFEETVSAARALREAKMLFLLSERSEESSESERFSLADKVLAKQSKFIVSRQMLFDLLAYMTSVPDEMECEE